MVVGIIIIMQESYLLGVGWQFKRVMLAARAVVCWGGMFHSCMLAGLWLRETLCIPSGLLATYCSGGGAKRWYVGASKLIIALPPSGNARHGLTRDTYPSRAAEIILLAVSLLKMAHVRPLH